MSDEYTGQLITRKMDFISGTISESWVISVIVVCILNLLNRSVSQANSIGILKR